MVDTFTRQEAAQLLGKTEAAVRQNLHAARKPGFRVIQVA
jgi:DNA-directed RNA polymerase specialized sigma24 family protein